MKKIDRRTFLESSALAGAGMFLGSTLSELAVANQKSRPPTRSRVVLVRSDNVFDQNQSIQPKVIEKMLDDGVCALTQEKDPQKAWTRLLSSKDILGIKTNVWKFLPTPPSLESALQNRACSVGIKKEAIAIDDRGVLDNPGFKTATALINVRTLRTHHWAGIGSCLKNYIMFHKEPWTWHEDSCANLAGLWNLPLVKGKTRLNIQVALTPLFHGKGPHHFQAEYTWPYGGLILGQDPVAVDAIAVHLLEKKRLAHFGKNLPFTVSPKHIQVAQDKYRLGIADRDRIDLVKIGSSQGMLI